MRSEGSPLYSLILALIGGSETRKKLPTSRNLYLNHPDPIVFIPLAVDTTGRLYEEFIRLLFLHTHREVSVLANESRYQRNRTSFASFEIRGSQI